MKIFVKVEPADRSINFVDEHNTVLGWSVDQICCENHSCTIYLDKPTLVEIKREYDPLNDDLGGLDEEAVADARKNARRLQSKRPFMIFGDGEDFYNTVIDLSGWSIDKEYVDSDSSSVWFRLYSETREMFVCLSNYHNGYYSHGFKLDVGGIIKWKGCI